MIHVIAWFVIETTVAIRDTNYVRKIVTHPLSISIGKTRIFVFEPLSFCQEWSDQNNFAQN